MKKNKKTIKWWIIGGTAVLVLIAVLVILLIPGEDIPAFGLKKGMSRENIRTAMEKKGMICVADDTLSDRMIFIGETKLFDVQPSMVTVIPEENKLLFGFCDETYKTMYSSSQLQTVHNDLRGLYEKMCRSAVKKLGNPKEETIYGAQWEKDGVLYELQEMIDTSYYFYFSLSLK